MATITEDVAVRVLIRADTAAGRYQDALHFTHADFDALKDEDLEAIKKSRVDAWLAAVAEARNRVPELPSRTDLEDVRARLVAEVAEIDGKLARGEHKLIAERGGR